METRATSEVLNSRRSMGNNPVIRNLRLRASEMMRALQTELDKVFLVDLNKLHLQMQKLLEREERKPQPGTNTAWSLERAKLENKITLRNEKEALRSTEYEEKEEDLKDKLDIHHDKIMESERHHNNAILDNVVNNTSIDIRIRAKKAEIDAIIESKTSSCWYSLFCNICTPSDIKIKREELQSLEREALINRNATEAADANKNVVDENIKREKTIEELNKLADTRPLPRVSESDYDEEKLADIKFLIEQARKNQTHLLANDAMIACIRFYEAGLNVLDHQPVNDVLTIDVKPKSTLDVYIGDDGSILTRLFKEFYCQDSDGLTTTFSELHDMFAELSRHLSEEDKIKLISDATLQDKLLPNIEPVVARMK